MARFTLSPTAYDYVKSLTSEFLCTFVFGFFIYNLSVYISINGYLTSISAAAFGLTLAFSAIALIASFGDVSGAHFNPAITFAAALGGKISPLKALCYTLVQLAGATAAAGMLYAIYPANQDLAAMAVIAKPAGIRQFEACAMEFILTYILIFVIYMVALGVDRIPYFMRLNFAYEKKFPLHDAEEDPGEAATIDRPTAKMPAGIQKGYYAGPAIGLTLGLLAMQGGTVSGGAFNPALIFGTRIVSGVWGPVWLYWLGEYLGAAVATGMYFLFFSNRVVQMKHAQ